MIISIEKLVEHYAGEWKRTAGDFPVFGLSYGNSEKKRRAKITDDFYARFKSKYDKPGSKIETDELIAPMQKFMTQVYDFPAGISELILTPSFFNVSKTFFDEAKTFDKTLSNENIFQALRNVWIMNGIQVKLDMPVELTPSIFAYSMLYPYSDNLLDDKTLTQAQKMSFNERFGERLLGKKSMNDNPCESKIDELVRIVEKQYRREKFPDVYESLLMIHRAQTQSVAMQHSALSPDEIIAVSFAKGGASVLADGFLITGDLTPAQQYFLFAYGIWLQLVDDIQDIQEDTESGTQTIFTAPAAEKNREENVNRVFNFGRKLIDDIHSFPSAASGEFGKIMVHAIELMIIQHAGLNPGYFQPEYATQLEIHSPLGFDYLRKMKKQKGMSRMAFVNRLLQS